MYGKDILVKLNNKMLNRGIPNIKDNIGYNKSDYFVCVKYYDTLTNIQACDLANRLFKYCNKQLSNISSEEMKKTAIFFKNIIGNETLSNSISIKIGEKYTLISLYNKSAFINIIRNAKDRKLLSASKNWLVSNTEVLDVLLKLKSSGGICGNCITYFKKIYSNNSVKNQTSNRHNSCKNSINIRKKSNGDVELIFTYNPLLIKLIRSLEFAVFNKVTKGWTISFEEIPELLKKIKNNNLLIDYSNLESLNFKEDKIADRLEKISNKQALPLLNIEIVEFIKLKLKFHRNNKLIGAINELPYRRYIKEDNSWEIHKDSANDLLKKIKEKNIKINAENLELIVNRQLSIYDKFKKLKLMDISSLSRPPFQHQIEGAKKLLELKRALLCDEQGAGKSFTSIIAANSIKGKKLVICPSSLKYNWEKEIKEVDPSGDVYIVNSKELTNINGFRHCKGWTIINYDILDSIKTTKKGKKVEVLKELIKSKFSVCICDEAHYCRSLNDSGIPKSTRGKRVIEITDSIPFVFLLTGTPIVNFTKDIFNLLKIVKHPIAKDFFEFAFNYCNPKQNTYGWNFNGSSFPHELHEKIKDVMIRRTKKELKERGIINLPDKIRRFIPVEVDLKTYNKKIQEYLKKKKLFKSKHQHLVELNIMKQELAKAKAKHLVKIVQNLIDTNKQVVLFTDYTDVVNTIIDSFKDIVVKVTGDVKSKDRDIAVEKFQNGEAQIFIGNIVAAGVGLTLTKAHTLIFNDIDFLPANHLQAEDRIHRISQDQICNIYYLFAKGAEIDEKLSEMLDKKLKVISRIVDGQDFNFLEECEMIDFSDEIINCLGN